MSWLFGKSKTPAEMIRQYQRALERSMRELDRERQKLEQQEKKIVIDIKQSAKKGQLNAVKIMAKDLVRTRKYVQKFYQMRAQLQAISMRMQTMKSTQAMADAMKGVTKAMRTMNKQINMPKIQEIMRDFERESEMMDMKEEMMSDAVDDVMQDEDDEEEEETIVNMVLEEIGVSLNQEMSNAPLGTKAVEEPIAVQDDDADRKLQERLDNLRK